MTIRSAQQLREDALSIWQAGVDSVLGDRLVEQFVRVDGQHVWLGDEVIDLEEIERLVVVGGGKAGASMAVGLERAVGELAGRLKLEGWLNIPEGCLQPTRFIHLHEARPAGRNEPTEAGVAGTQKMIEMIQSLGPRDWCLVLLSGGGSALLPAPVSGVDLKAKLQTTRFLSGAGANIEQLNTVRKALSRIKGGGLARLCKAGRLDTLIISDVLGDPLDVIASGPTVSSTTGSADAIRVLREFDPQRSLVDDTIYRALDGSFASEKMRPLPERPGRAQVIGNLAVAVDAAGVEAEKRGYAHAMDCARAMEGTAESVGQHHARLAYRMRRQDGPDCLITGGEPIVQLAPAERRGIGGRNQQLVLAALMELQHLAQVNQDDPAELVSSGLCLLSGGSDGEDGPTDAAGGWIDAGVEQSCRSQELQVSEALQRNDAYPLLEKAGGLLKTGPTHTNVCDLRVVVVDRVSGAQRI